MAQYALTQFMKIGAIGLGLLGLVLLAVYPPLGCFALFVGALMIVVGVRMDQREKARAQAALEERRHQEMLAAARGTGAAKDERSLGSKLGSL